MRDAIARWRLGPGTWSRALTPSAPLPHALPVSNSPSALRPVAEVPSAGTLRFLSSGDLMVLERRWESTMGASGAVSSREERVVARQYAPRKEGWVPICESSVSKVPSSPIGCAASATGNAIAVGFKTVHLVAWPDAAPIAALKGVKHQLERHSLDFSPSGALLAVGDGGYISPPNRVVRVFETAGGTEVHKIKTDEFSFRLLAWADERTLLVLGMRHDFVFGSRTEPQHVLACYDVPSGKPKWRLRLWAQHQSFSLDARGESLWISGELPVEGGASTQDLVCLSVNDGTRTREINTSGRHPSGVFGVTAHHLIVGWQSSAACDAVEIEGGAMTPLRDASSGDALLPYAAAHAETGRVALSLGRTRTAIFQLGSSG